MFDLTREELRILKPLKTPAKIQDFLNTIPMNFEEDGETCRSPRRVLRDRKAHCMEGAMLAALALRLIGYPPLIVHLRSIVGDFDHAIAVFQIDGYWGAIGKTNHGVLRYREPIYKNIRELVMTFFHEYFLPDGTKTLRSYVKPIDLSRFDKKGWMTDEEDVWYLQDYIESADGIELMTKKQIKNLRKADPVEREMGEVIEWKKEQKK